ncbi:MAG: glycosyltransferase family 39 protein [Patescibacteria group bacterium]
MPTILLLAAFLRLYKIADYMTFLGDEGRDVLIVYNILHGHLTLLGPTASVGGFFLGPIYYYFMAPFLWLFNYNPVGPAVMVALFGVAAVWLVYKVGAEFLGKEVGIIAAFLYSISPLVIAYSRSSWNPNLMPFFSLLTLYVLYKALSKNNYWLFILSGILLGILMQLHYLATFVGVIIVLYVLFTRRDQRAIKDFLFLLVGFILGWLPFLAFEVRHGFQNIISIFNFVFHSGDTGGGNKFFETITNVFLRLFERLVTNFPPPEQVSMGLRRNIEIWYLLTVALAITSTYIFLKSCYAGFKKRVKDLPKLSLLFIWFVVGISLFGFYKKSIYDYYFGFMFPLPFLLVGNSISYFWNKNSMGKTLASIAFIGIVFINVQGIPFRSVPNRQLKQVEGISQFVLSKTDGKPFNFALITGANSDHAYRYFFTLNNQPPNVIENAVNDPKRATVTDQLLVVCETIECHPLGNSLWEIAGFGRAEIVGQWDVSVVKVFKLEHYKSR